MKTSVLSAAAVLAIAMLGAVPANAAWSCSGPDLACAGTANAKRATVASTKSTSKASNRLWKQASYKRSSVLP
jgi:hypothetical protein